MLHTVIASVTNMSAAGTVDTLAAAAYYPSGENSVQERSQIPGGSVPTLVGVAGVANEAAYVVTDIGGAYYKISNNTWEQARYLIMPWSTWAVATGAAQVHGDYQKPINWISPGITLDRESDWTINTMGGPTANAACSVFLYESYGTKIPWAGDSDTWRLVSASTALTANTWGAIGTITDLDPRVTYRVNTFRGVAGLTGKSLMACGVTSPSNSTFLAAPCNQCAEVASGKYGPAWTVDFAIDSIYVQGVETITIWGYSDAGDKPSVYIGLKRMGGVQSGTGSAPGPASNPLAGLLNLGGVSLR